MVGPWKREGKRTAQTRAGPRNVPSLMVCRGAVEQIAYSGPGTLQASAGGAGPNGNGRIRAASGVPRAARAVRMKAFVTDGFPLPLPDGHRFPAAKYRLLRQRVEASGLFAPEDLIVPP